jgi:hypothetical protein
MSLDLPFGLMLRSTLGVGVGPRAPKTTRKTAKIN